MGRPCRVAPDAEEPSPCFKKFLSPVLKTQFSPEPIGKQHRNLGIRRPLDFGVRLRRGRDGSRIILCLSGSSSQLRDYLESGGATVLAIEAHRTRALAIPFTRGKPQFDAIPVRAEDLRPKTNPALVRLDLLHQGLFEVTSAAFACPL